MDSNGNPPPNNLITPSGAFTLAFDPLLNPTLEDQPIIAASSFTDNEGVTLNAADIFSTVSVQTIVPTRVYRILVGAIVSPLDSVKGSVGDTNDFRLTFDVFGGAGANAGVPTGVNLVFGPYDVSNGSLGSINGDLAVSLLAVSDPNATPIPLPAGLPLLVAGLLAFGYARSRQRS